MKEVLLIDDDDASTYLIKELLGVVGVPIIDCDSGNKALSLIREKVDKVGLILLDICLPDFDGWQIIKEIRKEDRILPVIAISALPPELLAKRYEAEGFNDYISKPINLQHLVDVVNTYVW